MVLLYIFIKLNGNCVRLNFRKRNEKHTVYFLVKQKMIPYIFLAKFCSML